MLQSEYYVIEQENNDQIPLFAWDQESIYSGQGIPVECQEPLKLRLGEPRPNYIEWADFHTAPEPIVSPALADVLQKLKLYGVQWIPAVVRDPKNPSVGTRHYYFMHVWNRIACLDRSQSEIITTSSDIIFSIEKLVMNEAALAKIELNKRLVFELAEKTSILIIHQSVKEAMEFIKAKGMRFFPAEHWNSDSTFDE